MSGMTNLCSAADLEPGQSGTIVQVSGEPGLARRLMEMGLVPGTSLRVVRRAPLGDPLEVEIRAFFLTLRRTEAAHVHLSR